MKIIFEIFLVAALSNTSAFAISPESADFIVKTAALIPLFRDYMDLVGVRLSTESDPKSTDGYNEKISGQIMERLDSDPKLMDSAVKFYARIREIDDRFGSYGLYQNAAATQRYFQEAGKGSFKTLEPGWLWRLAMELTDGDSLNAIRIIGVCGQDEKPRVPYGYPVQCPIRGSVLFLPKSLGQEFDIGFDTKKRIIKTYNRIYKDLHLPVDQWRSVPGIGQEKYYHVLASSYLSCEMIHKGYDPRIVEFAAQVMAIAYRLVILDVYLERDKADVVHFPRYEEKIKVEKDALELARQRTITLAGTTSVGYFPKLWFANRKKPVGWSQTRYKMAKDFFEKIQTDLEWTREQHQLGAQFAVRNCVTLDAKQ